MDKKMRLDRYLSNMGLGSRSEVGKIIKSGGVKADGAVQKQASFMVCVGETQVVMQGQPVVYEQYHYLVMNKPVGVICAAKDGKEKTVMELLDLPYSKMKLFTAGRLDKDTVGLLIITNDGQFAHEMLAPKKHVKKTYEATIEGRLTLEDIETLSRGVELADGYETLPAQVEVLSEEGENALVALTIMEGKYHQVKRMFAAVGTRVVHLKRVTIGGLSLPDDLEEGMYMPIEGKALFTQIFGKE